MQEHIARLARVLELQLHIERLMRGLDACTSAALPGLNYDDSRVLGTILRLGPISLKQAAHAVGLPKTTVHYIVGKLQAAGYLLRAPGPRRGIPVFTASAAGRQAWETAARAVLRAPFALTVAEMPDASLDSILAVARSIWQRAGVPEQNEAIGREARVVAISLAELTLQTAAGDEAAAAPPTDDQ